jgi:hypothetical protein
MGFLRSCCAWLAVLSLFYPVNCTCAQADAETAQDWFQRGVSLSRAAQWGEARAAYLRSLELEPRVSTYFNLATASLKLRLGRATLLALHDFAPLADPKIHAEFLAEAARMRSEALDLTGTVVLTGLLADATLEVDQEAQRWALGTHKEHSISLDPGQHVLTLRAPRHLTRSLVVEVARGVTVRRSVTLSALKKVAPDVPMNVSASPADSKSNTMSKVLIWSGVAGVGLGVLATVLVITFGSDTDQTPPSGGSLNMVFD